MSSPSRPWEEVGEDLGVTLTEEIDIKPNTNRSVIEKSSGYLILPGFKHNHPIVLDTFHSSSRSPLS